MNCQLQDKTVPDENLARKGSNFSLFSPFSLLRIFISIFVCKVCEFARSRFGVLKETVVDVKAQLAENGD